MFDACPHGRQDTHPPDHRHPHSNNQVSPCENLVNKLDLIISHRMSFHLKECQE